MRSVAVAVCRPGGLAAVGATKKPMPTYQHNQPQLGRDSGPAPIGRAKLGAQIVERLRDEIIHGGWAPGESLPSHVLSEKYGVSHIPIREAFMVLESEGFVTLAPNRMAIVTEPTVEDTSDKLLLLHTLEALAIELACVRASEEELDGLAALHVHLAASLKECDPGGYHRINLQFHRSIVTAAHNPTLADFHQVLTRHLEWARVRSQIRSEVRPDAFAEHETIVDCLLRRDAAGARRAIESHSEGVRMVLLKRIEDTRRQSAGG
jgi:DNA-binding GntR family transcriptional regulator